MKLSDLRNFSTGHPGIKSKEKHAKYEFPFANPDYPEQVQPEHDDGGWIEGDADMPIKWTGDHEKVYQQVMKHRKMHDKSFHTGTDIEEEAKA